MQLKNIKKKLISTQTVSIFLSILIVDPQFMKNIVLQMRRVVHSFNRLFDALKQYLLQCGHQIFNRLNIGELIYLFPIVIFSFVIRLYLQNLHQVLGSDESFYAWIAENLLKYRKLTLAWHPKNARPYALPPLFVLFVALFFVIFGISDFSAKLVSVTFGSLLVIPVYFLGKEVFNRKVGLVSALLISVQWKILQMSIQARREILFTFLSMLAIYFVIKGLNSSKQGFFAGLFSGLAFLTRYGAIFYVLIFLIFLVVLEGNLKFYKNKNVWIMLAVNLLLVVPWLLRNIYLLGPNMVFGDDGNIDSRVTGQSLVNIGAHINYTQTNPLLVIQEQGYWFYWLALQSFKLIAFPLSIFFFLGVIFALLRLIKGLKYSIIQNKKIFMFFIFELYFIGFFSFSNPGINYLTPLIPIMVILSAFFIVLLSSFTEKIISLLIEKYPDAIPFKVNKLYAIKIFIAASLLCIVLISFLRWSDLIISTRPSYQNYHIKESGLWIRHNTPEDSIISCERREIVFYAGRYWTSSKGFTLEDLQMKEINYLVVFPDDSWDYLMDIENAPKYLKPVRISQNRFVIYEFIYQ